MDFRKELEPLNVSLVAQDSQLEQIKKTERKYKQSGDIDTYIKFWENIWNNGGLLFNGTHWTFELCSLYYKTKQYDKAWGFLSMLTMKKPEYLDNIRRWQLKILKREKKDTSLIEDLMKNKT